MPIFRIRDKLHFYAHVPKCAGTSIEIYLEKRFGPLAFMNRQFLNDAEELRWTKSSPQHVPLHAFAKLVPGEWIESSFAVVRHPLKRLVSAFGFQANVEELLPEDWTIDTFFDDWLGRQETEPFLYDGHLLPQSDLVPEKAAIFQLENGLDELVLHLDRLAGDTKGARNIPVANVMSASGGIDPARLTPSPETQTKISRYYAEDFTRFGYFPEVVPKNHRSKAHPPGLMQRISALLRWR